MRPASEPVDYVAFGPVFGTTSKDSEYERAWATRPCARRSPCATPRPLVAIGGITPRAPPLASARPGWGASRSSRSVAGAADPTEVRRAHRSMTRLSRDGRLRNERDRPARALRSRLLPPSRRGVGPVGGPGADRPGHDRGGHRPAARPRPGAAGLASPFRDFFLHRDRDPGERVDRVVSSRRPFPLRPARRDRPELRPLGAPDHRLHGEPLRHPLSPRARPARGEGAGSAAQPKPPDLGRRGPRGDRQPLRRHDRERPGRPPLSEGHDAQRALHLHDPRHGDHRGLRPRRLRDDPRRGRLRGTPRRRERRLGPRRRRGRQADGPGDGKTTRRWAPRRSWWTYAPTT